MDKAFNDSRSWPPTMINIPGGQASVKDEAAGIRWPVDLPPYRIGRYPITAWQYQQLVNDLVVPDGGGDTPKVEVSWLDAISFCNQISLQQGLTPCYRTTVDGEVECDWGVNGYRLPSEAEWEFACRAGSSGVRYGALEDVAWYRENSEGRIHPVGSKVANAWGLHDTIGNAWEWCWDIYDPAVYGPYRVFRGGGWCDPARGCRASCRRKSHPTYRIDDVGFRLAQSVCNGPVTRSGKPEL